MSLLNCEHSDVASYAPLELEKPGYEHVCSSFGCFQSWF